MDTPRPARARFYAGAGLFLLIAAIGLIMAGAVAANRYSSAERCLSESGAGGSSGGSSGGISRTYSPIPSPLPGRCTGRVDDTYLEGSREEFPALMAAARDEATGDARILTWAGLALGVLGAGLVWLSRRVKPDPVAHHGPLGT